MFDISWGKLVIIGVVALIVIGPKELPIVLRTLGQWMAKIRRMAGEFQGQFNEAMREAEMADLKKQFDETTSTLNSALDPTGFKTDMEKLINDPMGTEASATSTPATPPTDPAVATPATSDTTPATDPVALGTAPVAPADIAVPMPDLPPPPESRDFATAEPAAQHAPSSAPSQAPSSAPAPEAPASAPQAPGGKAA
jgi:sec-independent protein translocase protein TatB